MEREWTRELIVNMLIKEMGQAPVNLVKAINRMIDDAYGNGWEAGVEDSLKEEEIDQKSTVDYFIEQVVMLNKSLNQRNNNAFKLANNTIFFDDDSDYRTALYEVCDELRPDIKDAGDDYIEKIE